jgi:hypothetical protein
MKLPANLKFNNYPQQFKIEDYQEVLNLAVEDLKKNKDVLAVYSMGQNWVPGLSDLDVIVVYRDGVLKLHSRDPRTLSEKAGYIFTHDYMHFNVSSFKNLYYVYPDRFSLQLLYGDKIELVNPQDELSEDEYQLLEVSLVMDFLVTKLLFPRYLTANPINIRNILLFIYSFTHTIEMIERLTEHKIQFDFSERIKELRVSWFLNKKEENEKLLIEAMEKAFLVTAMLVENLDDFLKTKFDLSLLPSKTEFCCPNFYIVGVQKWDKEQFWQSFIKESVRIKVPILGKILKNYKILVPKSFFPLFYLYANQHGPYGDWFKMFLKKGNNIHFDSLGIAKRTEVLNKVPVKNNQEMLFTLPFQYGFHTASRFKEYFRVRLVYIKRLLRI